MAKNAEELRQSAATILTFLLRERLQLQESGCPTSSNSRHFRELCSLLLWKHSEAKGKYRGCRYWTAGAMESYEIHGRVVTRSNEFGDDALRHEHLFPRKQLIDILFSLREPTIAEVRGKLDQLNIGVVVTIREHELLLDEGVESDPWERYRSAGIEWQEIGVSFENLVCPGSVMNDEVDLGKTTDFE